MFIMVNITMKAACMLSAVVMKAIFLTETVLQGTGDVYNIMVNVTMKVTVYSVLWSHRV